MKRWRGLAIGAGYFSQFHFDAWRRMEDVEIVAICDLGRGQGPHLSGKAWRQGFAE